MFSKELNQPSIIVATKSTIFDFIGFIKKILSLGHIG